LIKDSWTRRATFLSSHSAFIFSLILTFVSALQNL
jgi:hypothetical protein